MKKNAKILLTLSLLGTTLFACNSIPLVNQRAEVKQEDAKTFAITNESSDVTTLVGLPTSGVAGEEYSFIVSLKPGYHFNDKLTIKSGEENVAFTIKDGKYTFIMPEGAVSIKLDTAATEFTIYSTSMFVDHVLLDSENEEDQLVGNVRSTLPGTKLKFELKNSINYYCSKVMVNGVEVQESEEDGFYHFTMPARPVKITTDQIAKDYNITVDQTALKISTMKMFTNLETKEEITKAHKGQKVYFEFAYDVTKVDYKFNVEYEANGKDDDGTDFKKGTLEVTQVEGNNKLYCFEMVSSKVKVSITAEKDCTKYVGHSLVNNWKVFEVDEYSSSTKGNKLITFKYDNDSKDNVVFKDNGEGILNASYNTNKELTWDFDTEKATLSYGYSSTKDVYYTDHLITFPYSSSWDDAYFGITSDAYDIHVFKYGKYRIAWLEDESKNIVESLFLHEGGVYTNVTIKKQDGTTALGSDITLEAENLTIYKGEKLVGKVSKAVGKIVNDIVVDKSECLDVTVTPEGSDVAKLNGDNGEKMTLKISLKENAPAGTTIFEPTAKYMRISYSGTKSLDDMKLTKVADAENTYKFTMPSSEIFIYVYASTPNKEQNYSQLGTYKAFTLNTSRNEQEITSSSYDYILNGDGIIRKKNSSSESTYLITSIENKAEGEIKFKDCNNENTLYYSDGLLVTNYHTKNTDLSEIYCGVRLAEGETFKAFSHNKIDDDKTNWAISIFVNDTLKGNIFCFNGKIYFGVTFTFDEGSTKVDSKSSYHVYKGETLLFDVVNDQVTSHIK